MTTSELARILKVPNEEELYRVMRAASSMNLFREHPGRRFTHTDMSLVLRDDHPFSFRSAALIIECDLCFAGQVRLPGERAIGVVFQNCTIIL